MTITKKGETPVKESSLLASPEPITMYLLLREIFQYCTSVMSRGRLIGLITAVFTPFGLDTNINQILIASKRYHPRQAGGEKVPELALGAFCGPCWGKELLFCPKKSKKTHLLEVHFPRSPPMLFVVCKSSSPCSFHQDSPGRAGRVFGKFFNTALALCLEGGLSA